MEVNVAKSGQRLGALGAPPKLLDFQSPVDQRIESPRRYAATVGTRKVDILEIRDRGTAKHVEDIALLRFPFVGVGDATSETFERSPMLVSAGRLSGLTLGQLAALTFRKILNVSHKSFEPLDLARGINAQLAREYNEHGLNPEDPITVGGLVGVIGKFDPENNKLKLVQWGDVIYIVELDDETVFHGENMLEGADRYRLGKFAEIRARHTNGADAWAEYAPHLRRNRQETINKSHENPDGYPILNGQEIFPSLVVEKEFPLNRVKRVLVFTDGLVRGLLDQKPMPEIAKHVLAKQDMAAMLRETREWENPKGDSHIKHGEVTGIELKFTDLALRGVR